MMDNIVYNKSKNFAVRIIRLYKYLCESKSEFVMSKQLLRCGTSIGANIAEAEASISKKDFLAKVYISFKECRETLYWLELLHEAEFITDQEFDSIYADCKELEKLLSSITKTTKTSIEKS